jgi:hypothetical protein
MFISRTPEPERAPRTPYSELTKEQRRKLDAIAKSLLEVRIPRRFYLAQLREFVDSLSECFEAISDNQKKLIFRFLHRRNLAKEMKLPRKRRPTGRMSYFSSGAGTLALVMR